MAVVHSGSDKDHLHERQVAVHCHGEIHWSESQGMGPMLWELPAQNVISVFNRGQQQPEWAQGSQASRDGFEAEDWAPAASKWKLLGLGVVGATDCDSSLWS